MKGALAESFSSLKGASPELNVRATVRPGALAQSSSDGAQSASAPPQTRPARGPRTPERTATLIFRRALPLAAILSLFLIVELLLPLGKVVRIGADEDFELTKATLCLNGYSLYTEVWNDQPPLHTFLITQIIKHTSPAILFARLLTVFCATVVLAATFLLLRSISGLPAAALAAGMVAASPGFVDLSSSCMQEIPALAPVLAALCALRVLPRSTWPLAEVCGGALFGAGLLMKLIGIVYLPLALFILFLRLHSSAGEKLRLLRSSLIFLAMCCAAFVASNFATGAPLLPQLQQAWGAHFSSAKSLEYGSPDELGFDWSLLLKNWDATVPALLGVAILISKARRSGANGLPLFWLGLSIAVFARHKPWWSFYYVHNSIPLCWCAAVGFAGAWAYLKNKRPWAVITVSAIFTLGASAWMGARVYLQAEEIRSSPKLKSCLVLQQLQRFKPFTAFMFSDQPIFSFYSDIPMVPKLATISLKQMWTGEMSNARVVSELEAVKPGLVLVKNDGRDRPYQFLLNREYKLVYRDPDNLLYAHATISRNPWLQSNSLPRKEGG